MRPLGSRRPTPTGITALAPKRAGSTLTHWLYSELRAAILDGRLPRGHRLPATRELATAYGVSRQIVVAVFAQLKSEGYVVSRVGVGTLVSAQIAEDHAVPTGARHEAQVTIDRTPDSYRWPPTPFRPFELAAEEFPLAVWASVAGRVLRRMSVKDIAGGDLAGSKPLRQAVAGYLGESRGIACSPDRVVIVSGTQQALDLVARVLVQRDDQVWIEDPAYQGAVEAFERAGARMVPVSVDEHGIDPRLGQRLCPRPTAVYLTPANQFPSGAMLSLERRQHLLRWAASYGVTLVEDDYDSEFRFEGRPVPAMKSLDAADTMFLLGSFNKTVFTALRLGYVLVPARWMERVLALRHAMDRYPPAISQAVLARFIDEGHWARHLRRMRSLYGRRRAALADSVQRRLKGLVELSEHAAGLNAAAHVLTGLTSRAASERAAAHGLEAWPLDRFTVKRRDLRGLLLGFAAFEEKAIDRAVMQLGRALTVRR